MASRSLNKVMLIGNLTRDPELRYTPSGTPVCTFGLATNRSWTPSDGGERQEDTEFHRIVAWSKLAELCAQLLFKGRKTFVAGRIQTRKWTGSDGQERTTTEVVIDNMIVLDSRRREESQMPAGGRTAVVAPDTAGAADVADDKKVGERKAKKEKKAEKEVVVKEKKPAEKAADEKEEVKADDIPF